MKKKEKKRKKNEKKIEKFSANQNAPIKNFDFDAEKLFK